MFYMNYPIIILFFTTAWDDTILSLFYKWGNGGKVRLKNLLAQGYIASEWQSQNLNLGSDASEYQDFYFFEIISDLKKSCKNSTYKSIYTLFRLLTY